MNLTDFVKAVWILAIGDFGTGAVASGLAIMIAAKRRDFDKDMAFTLIKIFMGGAFVLFVFSLFYVYFAKH